VAHPEDFGESGDQGHVFSVRQVSGMLIAHAVRTPNYSIYVDFL
jgi:hypothetical protein